MIDSNDATIKHFGKRGAVLRYAVLGDSSAAGHTTDADSESAAVLSAQHLGQRYHVQLRNFAEVGATTKTVIAQAVAATSWRPHLVLIAVGANDVRRLLARVPQSTVRTIDILREHGSPIIVHVGSPPIWTSPLLGWPLRLLVKRRTQRVNRLIAEVCQENHINFAKLADQLASQYLTNSNLFSPDNYHVNAQGQRFYADALCPIVEDALAKAASA